MKRTLFNVLTVILISSVNVLAGAGDVYVEGNLGVGTTTPKSRIDVTGDIRIGNTTAECNSSNAGAIKFTGTEFYGCANGAWQKISLNDVELDLVNRFHSSVQCTTLGGSISNDGNSKFCRFSGSSCPSGWIQYQNWSQTASTTCNFTNLDSCYDDDNGCQSHGSHSIPCTTGAHSFSNNSTRETCQVSVATSCAKVCGYIMPECCAVSSTMTCTANVNNVGCY